MKQLRKMGAALVVATLTSVAASADGPLEDFEDPGKQASACSACAASPCTETVAVVEATELGALLRQVATRIEVLEAKVNHAVGLAEQAHGLARGPISQVSDSACGSAACSSCAADGKAQLASVRAGGACGSLVEAASACSSTAESACSAGAASEVACGSSACADVAPASDLVVLTALSEAELRLGELNARIAELEARESEILGNIEESLAAADSARLDMVTDLQDRTLQLKDMWMRQQGQVDMGAMLAGLQDCLLSMNLPQVLGGLVELSSNVDKMADMGLQPLLEEWSAATEEAHLGAGLIDAGRELEGVSLGMLLHAMADDVEGVPMPPEIAQGVAMAQGFGAQNFLPMLKSNLRGLSVAALVQPLAQELDGVTPAESFYGLADQLPGRVLPALAVGLGDSVEGMDLAQFLRIVAEEFGDIDARTALLGVDKLLRGEPPSVILHAMGDKLMDVDLGAALIRLGTSLEEVSVSNVAFRMSMELEGLTVAQAMDDLQMGLSAMGVPFDLPATLQHTGDYLARANLPQRMDGFQGMVDQLATYTEQVRREMGLYPHGEPDFWVEDPSRRGELAAEPPAAPERIEVEIVEAPVLDEQPGTDELVAEVDRVEQPVLLDAEVDRAAEVEEDAELRRTRLALQDLEAAGLTADHPAVQKLQAKLEALMGATAGGGQ